MERIRVILGFKWPKREELDSLISFLELVREVLGKAIAQEIDEINRLEILGEATYLDRANLLSRYAMAHFYRDGWFVCGEPTVPRYRDPRVDVWRTYSNRGGSDALALAVLRVHLVTSGKEDPVPDDVGCYF